MVWSLSFGRKQQLILSVLCSVVCIVLSLYYQYGTIKSNNNLGDTTEKEKKGTTSITTMIDLNNISTISISSATKERMEAIDDDAPHSNRNTTHITNNSTNQNTNSTTTTKKKIKISSGKMGVNGIKQSITNVTTTKIEETKNLFYLHIPKTGSTFLREIIQHVCPTNSTDEVTRIFNLILQNKHKEQGYRCAASLQPGHTGLRLQTPAHTVTMIRNPLDRIISGFLHNFHDCKDMQKKYNISEHHDPTKNKVVASTCQSIKYIVHEQNSLQIRTNKSLLPVASSENKLMDKKKKLIHRQWSKVRLILSKYMKCVTGCSWNMILGGNSCKKPSQPKYSQLIKLNHTFLHSVIQEKLDSFQFVGVTDEWQKSMCLWHHQFPAHKSGGEYIPPYEFNDGGQYRKTQFEGCKDDMKTFISIDKTLRSEIEQDPDWFVLTRSIQLLEARLPSHCKDRETAQSKKLQLLNSNKH